MYILLPVTVPVPSRIPIQQKLTGIRIVSGVKLEPEPVKTRRLQAIAVLLAGSVVAELRQFVLILGHFVVR